MCTIEPSQQHISLSAETFSAVDRVGHINQRFIYLPAPNDLDHEGSDSSDVCNDSNSNHDHRGHRHVVRGPTFAERGRLLSCSFSIALYRRDKLLAGGQVGSTCPSASSNNSLC